MKILILCGALVAIAAPAAAAGVHPMKGDPEVLQMAVSYADLDLSRPAGADVMIARIRRAAALVCDNETVAELRRVQQSRACMSEAMNAAFMQLGAPLVTARFAHMAPPAELAAK
ncbi:UrcA family protein [Phenylobacterium sp.]|jgi:UrcA family protein|uniref:UrcA family protein n=1 Tax=Phenylobacterium sp. TaxID=1871053 RepID=UPI002E321FFA|nr:UrcA family protein [Phenylobacterium sp.]HEX4710659.1 UrcA family protein [Phenylobacterium sp.]